MVVFDSCKSSISISIPIREYFLTKSNNNGLALAISDFVSGHKYSVIYLWTVFRRESFLIFQVLLMSSGVTEGEEKSLSLDMCLKNLGSRNEFFKDFSTIDGCFVIELQLYNFIIRVIIFFRGRWMNHQWSGDNPWKKYLSKVLVALSNNLLKLLQKAL